jgi:hypothetical protein
MILLSMLRQFAAVIARELGEKYADEVEAQPGRLLFPKHVHELTSLEPDAPDGLSREHIELAVARNEAARREATVDTAVETLAVHVSQQIGRAALLERQILEKLK